MARDHISKGRYTEVWQLAYPNMISMLLHNLMSIIDTIMIGSLGTAALAGVSLAQLVKATLFCLYKGTADSVLTYTAQHAGARQEARCGVIAWQGLYMGSIMGLLIFMVIPFVRTLFTLMNPAQDAIGPGIAYLRIALIAEGIGALTLVLIYFLRGLGDTRTPMRIGLFGNALNIVGNYLLIFGQAGFPRLGVTGAAISTTVAACAELGLLLWVFLGHRINGQYATRRLVVPRWDALKRIGKLAWPLSMQGFLEVSSFALFTVMIGRMGTVQLALSHIVLRLIVFAFLPIQGLAVAASTLVAQYLGADNPVRAEESGRRALHLGVVYMGGLGLLFICIPEAFLSLFTRDPQALAMGTRLLRLLGWVQAFDALYWVCSGVLKGAGDARWIMVATIVYSWLVFLPLAYLLGVVFEGGLIGAWVGFAVSVLLQGLCFWRRFKRGSWKQLSLLTAQKNG